MCTVDKHPIYNICNNNILPYFVRAYTINAKATAKRENWKAQTPKNVFKVPHPKN